MAQRTIIFWRDIPAQVLVKRGRTTEKRELPERFIQAIDQAAMKSGAGDTDAYLAEWRRGDPTPCGDDLASEADAAVAEIVATYDHDRLVRLAKAGGHDADADTSATRN